MNFKLTAIERSVGAFLLICFLGMIFVCFGVLAKNFFWQDKVSFSLRLTTAGQLQEGSKVQLKGMNIGKVTKVTLSDSAEIFANIEISREYYKFFTARSQVFIINPLLIGDKVVDLRYVPDSILAPEGSFLPVTENEDFSSKLASMDFKDITPILSSLKTTLQKTDSIAGKMNAQLPKVFAQTDKLSNEAVLAIKGTNKLIVDLQEATPLLKSLAKDLPVASDKSLKAISEAIVVLRAMQKSFFLKSGSDEVRKEIAAEEEVKSAGRVPASE